MAPERRQEQDRVIATCTELRRMLTRRCQSTHYREIVDRDAQIAVNSTDFAAFGDALLWTLERQFGAAFTPELRQAWRALYEVVRSDTPHSETPNAQQGE
jgi:hemoglobin-like flavoprotein